MPLGYRCLRLLARALVRIFFRRVDVSGLENVPPSGGGVVVAWHPNGLVDPILIFSQFPGQLVFGARHGLFSIPLFGSLLRMVGTVPIYRRQDAGEGDEAARRAANVESLDALAEAVAGGRFAALFPEGLSHDEPHPVELKTGAARLYYRALQRSDLREAPPVILPVGLHYDRKQMFGSRALVIFHPPLELARDLASPPPVEASREETFARWSLLTAELDRTLHEVVHATESWQLNQLMHRVRKLVRAERAHRGGGKVPAPDMRERTLGFARVWRGYRELRESRPEEVETLLADVRIYDDYLRALGLEDHELDKTPRLASAWLPLLLVGQALLVYLLFPPILVLGYLVNMPVALGLLAYVKAQSSYDKDEASLKVLLGAVAFPVAWLLVAGLVAYGQLKLHDRFAAVPNTPLLGGVVTFLLCAGGGYLVLHYQRLVSETWRSIRVRLTRARRAFTVVRLRKRRELLYEQVMALAEGLELPGRVEADGRVLQD